jgi:2-methylcitrate dehydratase PrpD
LRRLLHSFIHGAPSLDSFDDAARGEAAVLELAQRIREYRNPAWSREHAASGSLIVTLRSGAQIDHRVPHAVGHPGRPLSTDALIDKFVACAARASMPISGTEARSIATQVLALNGRSSAATLLRLA